MQLQIGHFTIGLFAAIVGPWSKAAMENRLNAEICGRMPKIQQRVPQSGDANFFFRPGPSGEIFYAGTDGKNYLLNPKEPHAAHRVLPGVVDPVPSPDGSTLVTLTADGTLALYDMKTAKADGATATPLLADSEMSGTYPSIGLIDSNNGSVTLRVLIDREPGSPSPPGLFIRDYVLTRSKDKVTAIPKGRGSPVCHNLGDPSYQRLPVLSKDGRAVSFFDALNGVGVIARLDSTNGSCTVEHVIRDPGQGKADFSFDNSKITFGSSQTSNWQTGQFPDGSKRATFYFRKSKPEAHSQAIILDRKTGRSDRLTDWPDSNAMYPSFDKDGTLLIQRDSFPGQGRPPVTEYVRIDPKDLPTVDLPSSLAACNRTQNVGLMQLSALWTELCVDSIPTGPFAGMVAVLDLPATDCAKMVDTKWDAFQKRVVERLGKFGVPSREAQSLMSKQDLRELCASLPSIRR